MKEPISLPKFYRFVIDQDDYGGGYLRREVWYGIKQTPAGWWIVQYLTNPNLPDYRLDDLRKHCKWVPNVSKKRFAYPTEYEALVSVLKRSERRLKYVQAAYGAVTSGLRQIRKKLEAYKDTVRWAKKFDKVAHICDKKNGGTLCGSVSACLGNNYAHTDMVTCPECLKVQENGGRPE